MADVFTITVPVPQGTYPSVNHVGRDGHRGGKKSDEYKELYEAVQLAAIDAMAESGWKKADYYVAGTIVRYHPTRHPFDASNLGKCEFDALEHEGVIENDRLIKPVWKDAQYDPDGPDRIVIVLVRLFPAMLGGSGAVPRPRRRSATNAGGRVAEQGASIKTVGIGAQVPTLNGRPISRDEAFRLIGSKRKGGKT